MKKYEQLEQQVKEMQAEIERLKSMERSQTLYDLIVEWINDDHCPTADKLVEKIKSWLPEEVEMGDDWNEGYNHYRYELLENLK